MVRDLSAEHCCALNKSPSDLAAHDESNRQFFLPGVVTALTQYGNDSSITTQQDSGEDTKEEKKVEDKIVILEEAANKLEGCFRDDCYPSSPEWDDHATKGLPEEPPINCMYCSFSA
jgi:hypothetical protein